MNDSVEAARVEYEHAPVGNIRAGEIGQVIDMVGRDEADALIDALTTRVEELGRGYHYHSMCRDDHEEIGWHPDKWEECPVCRMRNSYEEEKQAREQAEAEVAVFAEMLENELALWTPDKAMPLDYELSRPEMSRSRYEMAIRRDQMRRLMLGFKRTFNARAEEGSDRD